METPASDDFKMSLMDHLGELRSRLLKVSLSVLVLGFLSLIFAREIYGLLMRPVLNALPPEASSLVYTSAIEEINVLMSIGLYAGVFLSAPVLLYQIWGFVSPGLYVNERKLAGPFIFFGTIAFLAGAVFCYLVLLPQMFGFLLQKEDVSAITRRLDTAKMREEDALRYLKFGDVSLAAAEARAVIGDLQSPGEGQTTDGLFNLRILNKQVVDTRFRLEGLGRLIDAAREGFGGAARPQLIEALAKRREAIAAFGERRLDEAESLAEKSLQLVIQSRPEAKDDLLSMWELEHLIGVGLAKSESLNWTKPMLSMTEQLSLVMLLELAFGLIFELPLVMAILGLVGLVTSGFLFRYQRHALIVCLILAAVLTPTGDPINLTLMAGPMLLCYELGVLLVWLIEKRRKKSSQEVA
jgi:sec-independent protein translocase protein TatC